LEQLHGCLERFDLRSERRSLLLYRPHVLDRVERFFARTHLAERFQIIEGNLVAIVGCMSGYEFARIDPAPTVRPEAPRSRPASSAVT
jgi:hypothetical protein